MRKRKHDFKTNSANNSYYDLIEDYELIEASFAQQYGIRLRRETEMQWGEFTTLLSGLNEKTPLGRIVSIRSEKDPKIIKTFSPEQKKIRSEWSSRVAKNKVYSEAEYNQAMQNFANMFRAMAQ